MNLIYRPLSREWPFGKLRDFYARKRDQFRTDYDRTIRQLAAELRLLDANEAVIYAGWPAEHISVTTGRPNRNKQPTSPATILAFDSKFGPLRYGTDAYWSHEANLRAIVLSLEALRAVDRYGITRRGEQYEGWKALPPGPDGAGATALDRDQAADLVRRLAGVGAGAGLAHAYRVALKRAHPDVGGSREDWDSLQRAAAALSL